MGVFGAWPSVNYNEKPLTTKRSKEIESKINETNSKMAWRVSELDYFKGMIYESCFFNALAPPGGS